MSTLALEEIDGIHAVRSKNSCVGILPYVLDSNGSIELIGTVKEKNPHYSSGFYIGLILGSIEKDDSSLINRAKKELLEESGYDVKDLENWLFLGEMSVSKIMPDPIYLYAVNLTNSSPSSSPKGDGSSQEAGIEFNLISLAELQELSDVLTNACFFKLFTNLYKNQIV